MSMDHEITTKKDSVGSRSMEQFLNGLIKENPTFVLMLGMCPTLAVTTSAINGLGMGLTTTAVLVLSNMIISLLRNLIPNKVRIPAFIVIIASFVTILELLLEGFIPSLYSALGLYIPLIVVNCIILGRAEAFASKNQVIPSIFDGLGMGLGFTCALTCIGMIRELLGNGSIFNFPIINTVLAAISGVIGIEPIEYVPISIFVMAPGAFFVLAFLVAGMNKIKSNQAKKDKNAVVSSECMNDCLNCSESGCAKRFYNPDDTDAPVGKVVETKQEEKKVETEVKDNA